VSTARLTSKLHDMIGVHHLPSTFLSSNCSKRDMTLVTSRPLRPIPLRHRVGLIVCVCSILVEKLFCVGRTCDEWSATQKFSAPNFPSNHWVRKWSWWVMERDMPWGCV